MNNNQLIKTVDFRNAKYQGQTSYPSNLPHGRGVLLDQNYTCVLAEWLNGTVGQLTPEKQMLTIFGDSDKMYTCALSPQSARASSGLIIYEGQGYKIYKNNGIVVVDLRQTKNKLNCHLFKFQIFKQVTHKNTYQSTANEDLKLIKHKQYTQKQYINILRQFVQLPNLSTLNIQYEQYVRNSQTLSQFISVYPPLSLPSAKSTSTGAHTFRSQSSLANNSAGELTLRIKGVQNGIQIKSSKKLQNRLLRISYKSDMSTLENGFQHEQLCKKYQYYHGNKRKSNNTIDGCLVEQIINSEPKCFVEYQINRHGHEFSISREQQLQEEQPQLYGRSNEQVQRQCVGNLQQYYKRSLSFVNKFINISHLYKNRQYFKWIHRVAIAQTQDIYSSNPYKLNRSLISYKNSDHHDNSYIQINDEVKEKAECSASIDDIRREISRVEEFSKSRSISRSKCGISPPRVIDNGQYASNYSHKKQYHISAGGRPQNADMDRYKYTQPISSNAHRVSFGNDVLIQRQIQKQKQKQRQRQEERSKQNKNKSKRKYKYTQLNESMFKLDLQKVKKYQQSPSKVSGIKQSPPSKWNKLAHRKQGPTHSNISRHSFLQDEQSDDKGVQSPYRVQDSALTIVDNRVHDKYANKHMNNTGSPPRDTPISKLNIRGNHTNGRTEGQSNRRVEQQQMPWKGESNQESLRYEQFYQEPNGQQLHKLTQFYLHIEKQIQHEEVELSRSRRSGAAGRKVNYSTKNSTPRKKRQVHRHQQERSRSKSAKKLSSKPAMQNTNTNSRHPYSTKAQYLQFEPSSELRNPSKIASVYRNMESSNIQRNTHYRK